MGFIRLFLLFLYLLGSSFSIYAQEPPLITSPKETEPNFSRPATQLQPEQPQVIKQPLGYISHVHFRGGKALSDTELNSIAAPLIDTEYSVELATRVIQDLNDLYVQKGYPLSYASIGDQNFNDGRLTISLIEGYVARAEVVIAQESIRNKVNEILAPVLQEKPLTQDTLEKAVLLIKAIPGYRFQLALPKPKTVSGATSIRIEETERKWVEPEVSYSYQKHDDDNLYASLHFNSLHRWIEKVSLSGLIPIDNDKETEFYAVMLQHALYDPLGISGQMNISRYEDESDLSLPASGVILNIDQIKKRDKYRYSVLAPIILTSDFQWKVRASLYHTKEVNDYQARYQDIELDNLVQTTEYSAASLYTSVLGSIPDWYWLMALEVRQGINVGHRQSELKNSAGTRDFDDGNLDFSAVSLNAAVGYEVFSGLKLQLKGHGFYSDDALVSAERVSYGGQFYGRGYPEGQAEGDKGYGLEFMLSKKFEYDLWIVDQLKPYAVVDKAYAEFNRAPIEHNLASYALGLELGYQDHVTVSIEYAVPFDDVNVNTGKLSEVYNLAVTWDF